MTRRRRQRTPATRVVQVKVSIPHAGEFMIGVAVPVVPSDDPQRVLWRATESALRRVRAAPAPGERARLLRRMGRR